MSAKSKRGRGTLILCGAAFIAAIYMALVTGAMGKRVQLRSDCPGIEYVTEGETISCVVFRGPFPYQSIVPRLAEEKTTDEEGNRTEVYVIEAALSLNTGSCRKLYIQVSDEVDHTYVLRFADKDVKIVNGKLVEGL